MTSHAQSSPEGVSSQPDLHVNPGVLRNVHERARQRWDHQHPETPAEVPAVDTQEAKRAEMLANLKLFCQEREIDLASNKPADEPKLAHAIHDYVSGVVHKRARTVSELGANTRNSSPLIHIVPHDPIQRRIDEQYTEFGLSRRTKHENLRNKDDAVLAERKKKVFAKIHLQDDIGPDMSKDEPASEPRYAKYPEIGIVMQLRDICNDNGYIVAADGAEIVQAAYGLRFMDLVSYGSFIVENDQGQRRSIQQYFEIPDEEGVRAEEWKGIRGGAKPE